MSTIGDIITQLSTTTPLGQGSTSMSTFTSSPYVMGEYNSISVIYFSDQPNLLTIQWSADGVNWDLSKTYSLLANTPDQISQIAYSKWCQVICTNLNNFASETILRLEVYATTSNNAVTSSIQGNTSNSLPEFSVSDSFDYNALQSQHIESWTPQFEYNFSGLTGGYTGSQGTSATAPLFNAGYPNITYQVSNSTTGGGPVFGNTFWMDGSSIMIAQSGVSTQRQIFVWDTIFMKLNSGIGNRFIFTAAINRNEIGSPTGSSGTPDLFTGAGYLNQALIAPNNTSTGGTGCPVVDGLFFGYIGGATGNYPQTQNAFGIIYINGGVRTNIIQDNWNIDPCNGGGPVPSMPVIGIAGWANANTFSFSFALNGDILCYVQNPNSNKLTLVHVIRYGNSSGTNLKQLFSTQRFGMIMYSDNLNRRSAPSDNYQGYLRLFNYMSAYEQFVKQEPTAYYNVDLLNYKLNQNTVANTQYFLMDVHNSSTIPFGGVNGSGSTTGGTGTISNTSILLQPTLVSIYNASDPATISIQVLYNSGVTGLIGPFYGNQYYSPLVYYTATGGVTGTPIAPTGVKFISFTLKAGVFQEFDLTPYNIMLNPGDNFVIYYKDANDKQGVQLNIHMIFAEYH